ncbi:unnamed protein product [Anisakis simplex]|uniref:DUF4773 domain-containing protein n=1 Tax=Anisakis simplex TaxID=6269 RepID=A0A0M3IZR1_ANISI|nr:unnamed protein product [Anisakis simplex]
MTVSEAVKHAISRKPYEEAHVELVAQRDYGLSGAELTIGLFLTEVVLCSLEEVRSVELISADFHFTKQRTQKIGVGAIFNSELPIEQIDLVEEVVKIQSVCDISIVLPYSSRMRCTVGVFPMGFEAFEKECCIARVPCEEYASSLLPQQVQAYVDVSICEIAPTIMLTVPDRTIRDRSPTGVVVELEIEAGQEVANTEVIVDMMTDNFDEASLEIPEFSSDVLDVDVSMEAIMEEEDIEAVGPIFYTQLIDLAVQMPTAVAAVSRLIEEVKLRVLEADAEVKLAVSTRAEMQQLHLKLAKVEREFIEKYTDMEALAKKTKTRGGSED